MIKFNKAAGQRILELGGGDNPHPDTDCRVDVRAGPHTSFTADFEKPLPISTDEWDCVYSHFCLEHITWRKIPSFLLEVNRITKPGGKVVFVTANTEKQIQWAKDNPDGWDGKNFFESISCILFGDCDYPENSHKSYFSPKVLGELFQAAGFVDILISPYGARNTDLVVEANKPKAPTEPATLVQETKQVVLPNYTREQMYDKHYFNGGHKVGGYVREGYWDFPHHEVTFQKLVERKPSSVIELGCARGFTLRRLQDEGVEAQGLEISKHCYLSRACEGITLWDLCSEKKWPFTDQQFDVCFSAAVLEHIPEQFLPHVISESARVSKRALHGIDLGKHDTGFDQTHCSLFDVSKWCQLFAEHAKGYHAELVDKDTLEKSTFPEDVHRGDGRFKVNLGSCTVMSYWGWENVDILDLKTFADTYHYKFRQHDVTAGLPYGTGVVDMIMMSHLLEHLNYPEGLKLLKECRRVIRPDGLIRVVVPDADLLMAMSNHMISVNQHVHTLSDFAELNDNVERAKTDAQRLWALLHDGHSACYDEQTLRVVAEEAGFDYHRSCFRMTPDNLRLPRAVQMRREAIDQYPDLSLFSILTPKLA